MIRFGFVSFFICTFLFLGNCNEDRKPADIAPQLKDLPEFAGQWNLQGMELESGNKAGNILFLDPEKKTAQLGLQTYNLEMDSLGLRVKASDRENSVGYFLFSEIKEHTWVGTWEDRVIRLLR